MDLRGAAHSWIREDGSQAKSRAQSERSREACLNRMDQNFIFTGPGPVAPSLVPAEPAKVQPLFYSGLRIVF